LDTTGKETYNPNYVFCALVDGNNNKWFGSWGGGVSRFDGKQWKNFSMKDGLSGNIVYSMALDKKGIFWFGTNHGLSSYDGKIFKNYNKKDGLIDENVYAVAVDNRNIKWIGQKGGVVKLYEQLVTPKKTLKILPSQEKPIPLLEE
jgi:ligand-binding sensor domain-containing protein